MRTLIGWAGEQPGDEAKYYVVPFVITCAAALECSLNDAIIFHFYDESENAATLADSFLSMSLRGKLNAVVPLLTDNQFKINMNHKAYQRLSELIGLRNRLVHNKSAFEEMESLVVGKGEDGRKIVGVNESEMNAMLERVDTPALFVSGDAGRFHDALEVLHAKFLDIYKYEAFAGNELVIDSGA